MVVGAMTDNAVVVRSSDTQFGPNGSIYGRRALDSMARPHYATKQFSESECLPNPPSHILVAYKKFKLILRSPKHMISKKIPITRKYMKQTWKVW